MSQMIHRSLSFTYFYLGEDLSVSDFVHATYLLKWNFYYSFFLHSDLLDNLVSYSLLQRIILYSMLAVTRCSS